jgi:hypothetical protein
MKLMKNAIALTTRVKLEYAAAYLLPHFKATSRVCMIFMQQSIRLFPLLPATH